MFPKIDFNIIEIWILSHNFDFFSNFLNNSISIEYA